MSELVVDLTDPEDEDWLRVSEAGLVDLAISLPPGTDLMAFFRKHPETPMAKAQIAAVMPAVVGCSRACSRRPQFAPTSPAGPRPRLLGRRGPGRREEPRGDPLRGR